MSTWSVAVCIGLAVCEVGLILLAWRLDVREARRKRHDAVMARVYAGKRGKAA